MPKFLEGKKRYLGILTFSLSKLLGGVGVIDAATSSALEVLGGMMFGVGYVDAEKRKAAK